MGTGHPVAPEFLAKSEGIEGFEKIAVLERILPSFAEDEEFIELFLSEARLAAQLDHANIVHVHDIVGDGANFFFTMEYLHGHDRDMRGQHVRVAPWSGVLRARRMAGRRRRVYRVT